eukprot:TRINITY_DN99395_c0_g1_i1.p1 TRINITY_DN99395_c0_g1~~TRINITY_DN99395_c0_g1_i1.p1  ORF type:complete len:280 (-),score=38.15 TRINITY_DN99395_c0_g1_i1:216-1055(-)
MKKLVLWAATSLLVFNTGKQSFATEGTGIITSAADKQVEALYSALGADGDALPAFDVFQKAYYGFVNLQHAGKLNDDKQILTICDLSLSANVNRMWIIDLAQKKVLLHTLVAHGQGSGEEFAVKFSNKMNSHQTSLGFYVTGNTYNGDHGRSLYLHGMDKGYNNMAYQRDIVVHGAEYVSKDFICDNERLGRSWGCPAVPAKLSNKVIDNIKDGTCLFIYYPQKQYLKASVWLKNTGNMQMDIASKFPMQKTAPVIEYEYGPRMQAMLSAVQPIRLPLL